MKYISLLLLHVIALSACAQKTKTDICPLGDLTRGNKDSFVYAVIGDYGIDTKDERDVADMVMNNWKPAFIITTGDNDYEDKFPDTDRRTIDTFITKYYGSYMSRELSQNRFFPVMGNHDQKKKGVEKDYMNLFPYLHDAENFDFTWGPLHFYALNSGPENFCKMNDTMLANAQHKLDADTAAGLFRIALYHHPSYTSVYGSLMGNCFAEGRGPDIVLNGHVHYYERLYDREYKVNYITIGNSGRNNDECPDSAQNKMRNHRSISLQSCYGKQNGAVKVTVVKTSKGKEKPHWRMTFEYYNVAQPSGPLDVLTVRK